MAEPAITEVLEELRALRREVDTLRESQRDLKGQVSMLTARSGAPTAKAAPPPARQAPPAPRAEPPAAPAAPPQAAAPAMSAEQVIGERLLPYIGTALIVLGGVFFLVWQARQLGPEGKIALGLGASALLAVVGEKLRGRPGMARLGLSVIGGGWALASFTIYAARHVVSPAVLDTDSAALGLQVLASGGLVWHAVSLRSRAFTAYAFGLIYLSLWVGHSGLSALVAALLATGAAGALAAGAGRVEALPVAVVGFYVNYAAAHLSLVRAPPVARPILMELGSVLALGAAVPIVAALTPRVARLLGRGPMQVWLDASLCLSAILLGVFGYGQLAAAAGLPHALPGLAVAAVLAAVGAGGWDLLPRKLSLHILLPLLSAGFFALGAARLETPMDRLWGWIAGGALWTGVGLLTAQPYFRMAGAMMSAAVVALYWHQRVSLPEDRHATLAAPLLIDAAVCYAYGWWRDKIPNATGQEWEKRGEEVWFTFATVFLALGLWSLLAPAPFAVTLAAASLALELAAAALNRPALWAQAGWLAPAAAIYTFALDHGANLPMAAGLSPRLLVALPVGGLLAYLRFWDPAPASFSSRYPLAAQRRGLGWLLLAVFLFTSYHELGPRLRVGAYAAAAVAATCFGYWNRDEDLRSQGHIAGMITAWECLAGYAFLPGAATRALTGTETGLYWLAALTLLLPVALPVKGSDIRTPHLFGALSLVVLASFIHRELGGVHVTLGWSVLGAAYLAGGLALNLMPLRFPALGLLGLCVLKALFRDMAGLELPYRVASYVVLGLVLVAASYLYVGHGKKGRAS